jgi:2-polyprenyl-6-methoxyphenol hydroxylase-like FAD-dependent oxidoreductase
VEFYLRPNHRLVVGVPTNDGLTLIGLFWPHAEFHAFRADVEGNYWATLELAPAFAERVRSGRREERIVGTADVPNFYRQPYGPGWALVGDAGYHKDTITAQGIADAFRDAELLAAALDAGFSGRQPLAEALAGYQRQRDEETLPIYGLTCQFATLQIPPELQPLLEALRGNQEETDRFFGCFAGTTSIPEFFSPENTQRIIASAQRKEAHPSGAYASQ